MDLKHLPNRLRRPGGVGSPVSPILRRQTCSARRTLPHKIDGNACDLFRVKMLPWCTCWCTAAASGHRAGTCSRRTSPVRSSRWTSRGAGNGRPISRRSRSRISSRAVVDEIVGNDLHDVVLVGHSLAGVTLPGVVGAVPDRLRHVVFVSAAVPPDGGRVIDTLDPGMREYSRSRPVPTPAPVRHPRPRARGRGVLQRHGPGADAVHDRPARARGITGHLRAREPGRHAGTGPTHVRTPGPRRHRGTEPAGADDRQPPQHRGRRAAGAGGRDRRARRRATW